MSGALRVEGERAEVTFNAPVAKQAAGAKREIALLREAPVLVFVGGGVAPAHYLPPTPSRPPTDSPQDRGDFRCSPLILPNDSGPPLSLSTPFTENGSSARISTTASLTHR